MDSKDKNRRTGQKTGRKPSSAGRSNTATKAERSKSSRRPAPQKATGQRRSRETVRPQNRPAPEVVYTQPVPFNRGRFLLRLATAVAVVLALLFGMSIFFKVETVIVSGTQKYTAWDIREASGIEQGDNLLTQNESMIGGKIRAALPYVETVRVGIKLPDTVNIEIKEFDVNYSIEASDGTWWLISGMGTVLETTNAADAEDHTKILGVMLDSPVAGQNAVAFEPVPETTEASTAPEDETTGSLAIETTAPVTVRASERLTVALDIVQYLEDNGILGTAATVDVTDMAQLEIWYGQRYQIQLGNTTQLSHKITTVIQAMSQLGEHHSGVLDVSFTAREGEVVYTPFP